jgi:putative sigma-54 modulation protein
MNLTISSHHLEVTPALREYTQQKLQRLSHHFDHVVDAKVILRFESHKTKAEQHCAECTVHVKGHDFFAQAIQEDMYTSIDALADKLDKQIIKHKEKLTHHGHDSAKRTIS